MTLTRRSTLLLGAAALVAGPGLAQSVTNLRVQTANPGNSIFTFTTTFQTVAQRELPVRFNVTSGAVAPRAALDAVRGQVDLFLNAPSVNHFMSTGTGPFAELSGAPELFAKLRGLINIPLGPYHIITYADSGIETLEDIRGRRIFAGPPSGAATVVALAMIQASTGMVENQDYELANLDWTSGNQAFQDRQVDLAILPTELPSPSIQQFALLGRIRLIGVSADAFEHPPLSNMIALPGRTVQEIPAGTYGDNQINEGPVLTVGSWAGMGVNRELPEDLVYDLTRVIFENLSDFHQTADWMRAITPESAISHMNAPLHPGALRYYREAGVDIPDALIPPEAR